MKKNLINIDLVDLEKIKTIGIGGYGRVDLVQIVGDKTKSYALKQIRQRKHFLDEVKILSKLNSEFVIKLHKTFSDETYFYILMESCLGGDIWTLLRNKDVFNEQTSKFYIACVLEALNYLHSQNIIYRDLKSENLLLDHSGYIKLIDFGFAKKLKNEKTSTFCGTTQYLAPEVVSKKEYGIAVDYWALGLLLFEFLTGNPPFLAENKLHVLRQILNGIENISFPVHINSKCKNLIENLCNSNQFERIGYEDVKNHKWYESFLWDELNNRKLPAPLIQNVVSPVDCSNFDDF